MSADRWNHTGSGAWGFKPDKSGAEWTRTTYKPYPYKADGRDASDEEGRKVVRGAKGLTVPDDRIDTYRLSYHYWQPVWDVGFRVVCEDNLAAEGDTTIQRSSR